MELRQDQVSATRVMVVGCGALGNEVLKNLVLMGVEHIVAVDFDVVEMGNLSRSVLFCRSDAQQGRLKVEAAAERLRTMNPDADVRGICGDVAYDVGLGLIRQMDVVIGCVDSRWARFCINRLCMRAGVPWVDGGIDGLEGTARVFAPGQNCYACNLGPEGRRDLARRMPCSGTIRRMERAGSAPTTSIVASVIGAVEVQEALKITTLAQPLTETTHPQPLPVREGSLCGRMFYYDGETMNVRTAHYRAYDDDCAEHEQWEPVESTTVGRNHTVADAIRIWRMEWGAERVTLSLVNDCFVDYVSRRDNDERVAVMLPGRRVEAFVAEHAETSGLPLGSLYQHEYRRVDETFPYGQLTLAQIGIPERDIVRVTVDGKEKFLEVKSDK